MTLTLDLSPIEEAQIAAIAQRTGLSPAEAARKLLTQNLPAVENEGALRNAPSISLLRSWLTEEATDDPDEIRQAQKELDNFKRSINASRAATGERLIYPEVEPA